MKNSIKLYRILIEIVAENLNLKKTIKVIIAKTLNWYLYLGLDAHRNYWQMSSLDETKAAQLYLVRSSAEKFVQHNQKYLSRIYPKGTRVFSSNYDPIPSWLEFIQLCFYLKIFVISKLIHNPVADIFLGMNCTTLKIYIFWKLMTCGLQK